MKSTDNLRELTIEELNIVNGGVSEITGYILYFLGMAFMNAGAMASEGAAGHEIMGSK